jgi:Holliday junction resolvase RusA-like endonuclease
MTELKIELPLPPTLNHAYRSTSSREGRPYPYKTSTAKAWQRDAWVVIQNAKKQQPMITGPCKVSVELHVTYKRDIDSSFKLLFDVLQTARVYKNDGLIVWLEAKRYQDKLDKVVIYVTDLGTTPEES